jgi:hypothetical protein
VAGDIRDELDLMGDLIKFLRPKALVDFMQKPKAALNDQQIEQRRNTI